MFNSPNIKYLSIPAAGTRRDLSSFTINEQVSVTHLFSWVIIGCDIIGELAVIGQNLTHIKEWNDKKAND